jgi:hypothetical protein
MINSNTSPLLKKKKVLDKRIPTMIGLSFLVIALVVGTLLLGKGGGVFAPRAAPETTPTKIRITNVTDNSFTVSFVTSEKTAGFVKYGTEANAIKTQSGDDRDQLSGTVGSYTNHHVSIRGLSEDTNYYFLLGTGAGSTFDNNGAPFSAKTARRAGSPSAAKTVYGSVTNPNGAPADGAIVYISLPGAGDLSSLVKSSGSWAIPLSNARTPDGTGYAQIGETQELSIVAQGTEPNQLASTVVSVAQAQPVPSISLGGGSGGVGGSGQSVAAIPSTIPSPLASPLGTPAVLPLVSPSVSPTVSPTPKSKFLDNYDLTKPLATDSGSVVNLDGNQDQVVTTTQPIISGTAVPNVTVTITIHSDTNIVQNVTSNGTGSFSLDISSLAQNLEPGEHTATFSYTDPVTGKVVSQTISFTVVSSASSSVPYGSGNPYPISTASASPSASASASPAATDSGRVSQPSTESGIPTSGSVGTTWTLVIGGLFFILAGVWSFWISQELKPASKPA